MNTCRIFIIFMLFVAQLSFADIDCSSINSSCDKHANTSDSAPVENHTNDIIEVVNFSQQDQIKSSSGYQFTNAPGIDPDIKSAYTIKCVHPKVRKKSSKKDHRYREYVNQYCGCIRQNVVKTIKNEKLSCDSFNSYLEKAKNNMQNNSWRFAGAAWISSFHSRITVINTLNSAFETNYDSCSVNKLVKDPNGFQLVLNDLKNEFDNLKQNENTPKRMLSLKKCVDRMSKMEMSKDPEFMSEINRKMQRNFGMEVSEFAKNLKNEFDYFTGAKKMDGACTSPAEQMVLKSIPSWEQLEVLQAYKDQLTPHFLDDLYRKSVSLFGLTDLTENEKSLLRLFDNEPRLKLLFSKSGVNTDAQREKLFETIGLALKNKKKNSGKFANITIFENLFKDPYYKEIVKSACNELSNDLVALMCAEDEDFPLSDRSVITSIPDNYNLLGDAGTHLDKELQKVAKTCGPEAMEHGCQARSLPFETVYCESVKDDELQGSAENGAEDKFLDSQSIVSNSRNSIFTDFVYDSQPDAQKFKSLKESFEEKKDMLFGSPTMCSQIASNCSNLNKNSYEYVNCRFKTMSSSSRTKDGNTDYLFDQLNQYSEYVDFCMKKADKKKYDEICRESMLKVGLEMSNDSFSVNSINPGSASVTYGLDPEIERISTFDPSVPQEKTNITKINLTNDNDSLRKQDEKLSFSSHNASKVQKNLENTINNLKNNDLNFSQQVSAIKNVQPAIKQQIIEKEHEITVDKENISSIDQKVRKARSTQERELLELERALLEKNLKEKEKSLSVLKGQADRLSQLVQDLERKISDQGISPNSNIKNGAKSVGGIIGEIANPFGIQNKYQSNRGNDFKMESNNNVTGPSHSNNSTSATSGSRAPGLFKDSGNDEFNRDDSYTQSEQGKIDRDRGSLKLSAVPMTLTDLSQIESVEKLQEVLSSYGLTDGPFYLYDKKSDTLTKVIGYKVVDNAIVYEVLKDGQVEMVQAKKFATEVNRMPASTEPAKVETTHQVRKYSLEILSNILKLQN